jgi:hypothetical protein
MTTLSTPARNAEPSALTDAITRLREEAAALALALLDPNPIIEEVRQMHALQVEANRIEAADPARASSLRERASRIGLGPCAMTRGEAKAPE